jgi:hypothetical protein
MYVEAVISFPGLCLIDIAECLLEIAQKIGPLSMLDLEQLVLSRRPAWQPTSLHDHHHRAGLLILVVVDIVVVLAHMQK